MAEIKKPVPVNKQQITKTAGGIVVQMQSRKVLVVNQNHNSWSLPKGQIDRGENALEAAIREIHEESGVNELHLLKNLGKYERFRIGIKGDDDRSDLKRIWMFLFETHQEQLRPIDPRNPEARWVSPDKVADLLTHKADAKFFKDFFKNNKAIFEKK